MCSVSQADSEPAFVPLNGCSWHVNRTQNVRLPPDFCNSADAGGERAALLYSLIGTCKLNGVEPEAWLRYVIGHIQDWPANRVRDQLPCKVDLTSW